MRSVYLGKQSLILSGSFDRHMRNINDENSYATTIEHEWYLGSDLVRQYPTIPTPMDTIWTRNLITINKTGDTKDS